MLPPGRLARFVLAATLALPACSADTDVDPAAGALDIAQTRPQTSKAAKPAPRPVGPRGYTGPLPPVPFSPQAAAPPDVVRAVYEFAARRPDVLRFVPCFCGCERSGHQDNEDCFVESRAADGRPSWTSHGLT